MNEEDRTDLTKQMEEPGEGFSEVEILPRSAGYFPKRSPEPRAARRPSRKRAEQA